MSFGKALGPLRQPLKRVMRSAPYRLLSGVLAPPDVVAANLVGLGPFVRDWRVYNSNGPPAHLRASLASAYPCLADRVLPAGTASGHYFHQDLWFARRVYEAAPADHWDVGSRVDGFISHLLVFRSVRVIDVRPGPSPVPGLSFEQGDVTALPMEDQTVESISSLHVIEHIGLGRYGDKIDPLGHLDALRELQRVVRPGGTLYVSFPIGRERVEFNAHRVLHPERAIESLSSMSLSRFAAVSDDGDLVEPAAPADFVQARYACGLYVFRRAGGSPVNRGSDRDPVDR